MLAGELAGATAGALETLLRAVISKLVAGHGARRVLHGQQHVKLLAHSKDVQCLAQKLAGKLVRLSGNALAQLVSGRISHEHPLVTLFAALIIPAFGPRAASQDVAGGCGRPDGRKRPQPPASSGLIWVAGDCGLSRRENRPRSPATPTAVYLLRRIARPPARRTTAPSASAAAAAESKSTSPALGMARVGLGLAGLLGTLGCSGTVGGV